MTMLSSELSKTLSVDR